MAKAKSKKELVEMSKAYFKAYGDEDTFYATSDGQFFTGKNKSAAVSHARTLNEEVTVIERTPSALQAPPQGEDEEGDTADPAVEDTADPAGLSPEGDEKTAEGNGEVNEAIEAETDGTETVLEVNADAPELGVEDAPDPAGLSPEGDEKTAEGNGEVNEAIEAETDGTETVLEVNADAPELGVEDAPDPAGLSPEGDEKTAEGNGEVNEAIEPEYSWTMERMADWMNEHDGDFDLKDNKSTLWKKVKAHHAKLNG